MTKRWFLDAATRGEQARNLANRPGEQQSVKVGFTFYRSVCLGY